MDALNDFFKRLYSNPALMWKAGASLVFLSIAFAIYFVPSLLGDIDASKRNIATLVVGAYAIFRTVSFYMEYKQVKNEEQQ